MIRDLQRYKSLIKERCGLLIEGNNQDKLAQGLAERIQALAIKPGDYFGRLSGSDSEFRELVNLLTVNETYFFREPEQIRLLVDRLAPRFLASHDGRAPVSILSAGCSSGEEPYSLAMALLDKYGESVSRLFTFAGSDIDSTVLAKARNARYTEFSFRGVSPDIRSRYFDKDQWGNVLKTQVKNLVSFHELNLMSDSSASSLRDFDIIFFRNVSIYFDTPTRKVIQQKLATLMKNDGVLVIGTAETLANDLGVLPLFEEDGLFYFVKGEPPLPEMAAHASANVARTALPLLPPLPTRNPEQQVRSPLHVVPGAWVQPAAVPPVLDEKCPAAMPTIAVLPASALPLSAATPKIDLVAASQLIREKHYNEALPTLDAILLVEHSHVEACLLKAHVLLNRKDFAAADDLAQRVLAVDNWSVDAFVLLGLAAKWRQLGQKAISWFKKAVYACHECWPAHYYLADLYRVAGDVEQARRSYSAAIQLLSDSEPNPGIKYVPLGLPTSEVRFLCKHQLAKLPGAQALVEQR